MIATKVQLPDGTWEGWLGVNRAKIEDIIGFVTHFRKRDVPRVETLQEIAISELKHLDIFPFAHRAVKEAEHELASGGKIFRGFRAFSLGRIPDGEPPI